MDRYLIAIDMDGTLLNSNGNIIESDKKFLKKISEDGHLIILASGRPVRSMLPFYNDLELRTPLICFNGALVYSPFDKNFPIKKDVFKISTILDFYARIKPYISNIMCEADNDIYIDKVDPILDKFFWYKGMNVVIGDLNEVLDKNPITTIGKLNEFGLANKDKINEIISKYEDIELRFWTGLPYFELFCKNTTKGDGLIKIAKYYNLQQSHIIAIGDSDNDKKMLEIAGYGVAMNNAKERLKNIADIITTKNNNESGFIEAIEDILNGKYKSKY